MKKEHDSNILNYTWLDKSLSLDMKHSSSVKMRDMYKQVNMLQVTKQPKEVMNFGNHKHMAWYFCTNH